MALLNLFLLRYFAMLNEYLTSVGSRAVPLLKRLEEYYVFGTYQIIDMHLVQTFVVPINAIKYKIELFFLDIHGCLYQQYLSKFVDAFWEGKDNKQPRFPTASWSVFDRVLAGKIYSFMSNFSPTCTRIQR